MRKLLFAALLSLSLGGSSQIPSTLHYKCLHVRQIRGTFSRDVQTVVEISYLPGRSIWLTSMMNDSTRSFRVLQGPRKDSIDGGERIIYLIGGEAGEATLVLFYIHGRLMQFSITDGSQGIIFDIYYDPFA